MVKTCRTGIVKQANQSTWDKIAKSAKPVVVQMYSNYCSACEESKPHVEAVACELDGKVDVYKVDVDANPKLADQFKVDEIPTIMVMKNGKAVKKSIGVDSKEQLLKMINAVNAQVKKVSGKK